MQLSAFAADPYYQAVDGVTFYFLINEDGVNTITITNSGGGSSSSSYYNTYSGDVVIPSQIQFGPNTYTVTEIGEYAFASCYSLTSVVIPVGVTSIGSSAFYRCSSLTSVVIPGSVISIGYAAFSGCSSLTSVVIPEGVTSIGQSAFYKCTSLTSVVIPKSVTTIGDYAFVGCSSLTSVVIPEGVKSIENETFSFCSSLTSVVIPESVISIGDEAFCYCSSLTSLYIKGTNMPVFGTDVFYNIATDGYLYVSVGMKDAYWTEYWNIWGYDHIIELKDDEFPKGLSKVTSPDAYEIGRYNLQGQKLTSEQKGINIIKYSDGTTQKVLVK